MLNQTAASKARQVTDEDLVKHNLDKLTDQICAIPPLQIARLRADERRGRRHGDSVAVSIPFDGDAKSLEFRPSSFTMPNVNIEIHADFIRADFPDDDRLDTNVDALIKLVSKNAESLRQEWSSINATAKVNVSMILENRRKDLEAQKARDATRSFPID